MDYTKGPWTWNNFHDAHTALIRTAELKPGDKRTVLYHAAEWEMLPADKNLIQAAPDMYEALRDLIESYDVLTREVLPTDSVAAGCVKGAFLNINKAHQALKKAEGRED